MSCERWEIVEELFEQALERPPAERRAFLRASCADPVLLRAAESLVESDAAAGTFMPSLLPAAEEDPSRPASPLGNGRRIGPYRLIRKLGEGGMSTVYLADRADRAFRRRVVVKVVRHGMESGEILRRLRTERQILASLDHPNVARLYDGGTTEEGAPYFVIEHVDGLPIDEYCDRRRLSTRDRVALLRKVCSAVHDAHQNLVIHRDLKPSNILVTAEGEPKLLDFGIAKLLAPRELGIDAEATAAWMRWMTPHYASPEQIRGGRITTASDVYALGVLLYKLLTGRLPRSFEGRTLAEIEQLVTAQRPVRPSRRLDPKREPGRPRIHRDLDNIVLKALEDEPQGRYGSVEQLSDDLRRFLEGFPVKARPATPGYRAAKFLRRNRLAVAASAMFLILLAGSTVALALQSARITRERDQLQAVIAFVKEVFRVAGEGEELTVRQAVDRSSVILARTLREQPEVRATLLDTTGTIYLNLWVPAQASLQLAQAVEARRELYGDDSLEVAESLSSLGVALALQGEYEQGEARVRDALARFRRLLGPGHPDLVKPINNHTKVLCFKEDYGAAEAPSAEALSLARELLDEENPELAQAIFNRAVVTRRSGDLDQSVQLYRRALELYTRNLGDEHPEVAAVLNNLALVLRQQDELDEAEDLYRKAVALHRKLIGDDSPKLAQVLYNLGTLLRQKGALDPARNALSESLVIAKASFGPQHPSVLRISTALAITLIESGDPRGAEALLHDALELWRENLSESWLFALAESLLGESLTALGRYDEAEPLLERSYAALEETFGEESSRTRSALRRLQALRQARAKDPVPEPSRDRSMER